MVELGRLIDAISEQLGSMGIGCVVESGAEHGLYLEADEGALRTAALLLTAHLVEQAPERPVHFSVETAIVDGATGMDSRKYAVLEICSGESKDGNGSNERFLDDSSAQRHLAIHSSLQDSERDRRNSERRGNGFEGIPRVLADDRCARDGAAPKNDLVAGR